MTDDLLPEDLRSTRRRRLSLNDTPISDTPSCDIEEISKGKVIPYQAPGAPSIPPTSEAGLLAEHLKEMNAILDRNNNILQKIEEYLSYKTPTQSYFEIQTTSTVATPPNAINPNQDPNNLTNGVIPGYDQISVNDALHGRNAPRIWLVNDGLVPTGLNTGDDVFVITSVDGRSFSPEFRLAFGETRIIADVYEIRFRCRVAGNFIRASEREIVPPYVSTIIVSGGTIATTTNRPAFITRSLALPITDTTISAILSGATITIPNGFAISMIANVNNGGQVYISNTDALNFGERTILAAGDVRSLFVTNTDIIHVAGSMAGQFLDIIVEQ